MQNFLSLSTDFNEKLFRFSFVPFYVISIFTRNAKNEANFSLVFSYYPDFSRREADSSRLRTTKISHLKNSLENIAEDLFTFLEMESDLREIYCKRNSAIALKFSNKYFSWISRTLFREMNWIFSLFCTGGNENFIRFYSRKRVPRVRAVWTNRGYPIDWNRINFFLESSERVFLSCTPLVRSCVEAKKRIHDSRYYVQLHS